MQPSSCSLVLQADGRQRLQAVRWCRPSPGQGLCLWQAFGREEKGDGAPPLSLPCAYRRQAACVVLRRPHGQGVGPWERRACAQLHAAHQGGLHPQVVPHWCAAASVVSLVGQQSLLATLRHVSLPCIRSAILLSGRQRTRMSRWFSGLSPKQAHHKTLYRECIVTYSETFAISCGSSGGTDKWLSSNMQALARPTQGSRRCW